MSEEPVLTADRVNAVFGSCVAADGITAEGIVHRAVFSSASIDAHREEIRGMLAGLPDEFRRSGGGGWSFLNACLDRHGNQWTGMH
jgi:hypothetical protein